MPQAPAQDADTLNDTQRELQRKRLAGEPTPDDHEAVRTNQLINSAVEIAGRWNEPGQLVELLIPLLDEHEVNWVRYD